jgi:hypothetical protein
MSRQRFKALFEQYTDALWTLVRAGNELREGCP